MEIFRPDKPVEAEGQDKFQRYSFAKRIAGIVTDNKIPQSLVIGIYGKWGEGKTSVLKFIQSELEKKETVIINFNPWLFSDQKQLLKSFFESVALAVNKKLHSSKEIVAKTFSEYADSIGALAGQWIPGAGAIIGAGKKISEKLRKDSIEDLKKKVDDIIIEANTNFVVFIDDIDRLDIDEVQSVFKLVKLVGDFPRTSYILSFDHDMVASALGPSYASGDKQSGYDYLEKIIQIPLHLPKASKKALRDYTLSLIDDTLKNLSITLEKKDTASFVRAFDDSFLLFLENPRLGVRLNNSIGFAVPLLKGEVNLSDLMIIEGIKVFFPQLYQFIRDNGQYFLRSYMNIGSSSYSSISETEKATVKNAIDNQLLIHEKSNHQNVLEMLLELFPLLKTLYRNMAFPDYTYTQWYRERRICTQHYFPRYFSYVVVEGDISDVFFDGLFSDLESIDEDDLTTRFVTSFNTVAPTDLVFKLRHWEREFKGDHARKIAVALATLGDKFTDKDQGFLQASTFGQAAYLIATLIKNVTKQKILSTSIEVLEKATPLKFSIEIAYHLRNTRHHILDEQKFEDADITSIRRVIVQKFKKTLESNSFFSIVDETNSQLIIYWWFQYDNPEGLKQYIADQLEIDRSFAMQLLKSFVPTIRSLTAGVEGEQVFKSDFTPQTYADLSQIVDSALLLEKIEAVYGSDEPIEGIPESKTPLTDELIRKIFKKIHLQAQSNEITLPTPWLRAKNIELSE